MDLIPLDEVARITSSESNEEQPQDTKIFKTKSKVDEDFHMPMTPGLSNIVRIETIPEGFNSARTYHLKVIPLHPSLEIVNRAISQICLSDQKWSRTAYIGE
jgi:hypothetical protein